jgi:hypothetical protein
MPLWSLYFLETGKTQIDKSVFQLFKLWEEKKLGIHLLNIEYDENSKGKSSLELLLKRVNHVTFFKSCVRAVMEKMYYFMERIIAKFQ